MGPLTEALAEIAAGRPVVVAGTHGDLVFAGSAATPALVALAVRHTDGFVCVAMTDENCNRLGLPPMYYGAVAAGGEAFTVTVDARTGGTGISATDRAHTIRLLADPAAHAADFARPGHVVPIRTSPARAGRAEAALELVRLAGKGGAAVLSGIVSERSVGMAGPEELAAFAATHGLTVVSAAEVLENRPASCDHCGHLVAAD
ncbi:3,4-dihydroxy-2-butanone-4-phosphate synthase [Lentzea sp. JNUCC 0626]|uniref:3,4-dihydroxy-2-butanone-4-phosphate synthase n=1 Tax=Lentzea sp. JNUCC 0626 TaxID=3367513 RepID=UPI0037499548